ADDLVEGLARSRALRIRASQSDPLVGGRRHERFDQFHRGVRIVGGDVARQSGSDGTVSVFGMIHSGLDIDVDPALSAERARAASGTFLADDPMRPAAITTYDMKGSLARTTAILNRVSGVTTSDIGADTDNVWNDPTVVDAHVYAGWYYDYLFKRFGRRG